MLHVLPSHASVPLLKLVRSAAANAVNNAKMDRATLRIKRVTVDGGPTLKRYRPRARGAAFPIRKRSSHITVVVEGKAVATAQKTQRAVRKRSAPATEQHPKEHSGSKEAPAAGTP